MNQSRAAKYVAYLVTAIIMIALSVTVLFAACFVLETEKKVALCSTVAIVAICVTPQFRRRLREQCSIFFLLVTAYILLAGASTFYAYAPKFALSEFSRLLAAYAVFLAVFSFAKRETFPNVAAVLCGATSLLSLLHLDAASAGLIAHDIMRKFQMWTGGYTNDQYGQYTYGYNAIAGRVSGLFGNSNSMATMCAIGIFLALYLLLRATGYRRLLPCVALLINAVTFLMCISLGATMSLGLTVLLVLLFLHGAYNRLNFLLVTLETLAVSDAVATLSFSHMGNNATGGYLVLVFCAIGSIVLFGVDWLLRPRVVELLSKRIKALLLGLIVLVVLLGAAGLVAFTQTSNVVLQGEESVYKRFFPGTGLCEISLQIEGNANLWIASTSKAEILMKEATVLSDAPYEGPVEIEIPEDAIELQIIVKPVESAAVTVHSISYSGSEKCGSLAAGYRWISNEMMERFQGLTTNHSAIQRLIFMQDGLKMWKQNPVFGRGLGGFENGLASVQNFFYETKYAHNHYIQVLCDLGLVGLLLFVSMLGVAIHNLWLLRCTTGENEALIPALLGAVLIFAIHSGLEISASMAEVSILAFGTFGLVAYSSPVLAPRKHYGRIIALAGSIGLGILSTVYGFFLAQNARATEMVLGETVTTSQLKKCVQMDVFEGDDYRLTYVVAAMSIQDEEVYQQADIYADELQAANSNAVGPYLTEYYLHRGNYEKAKAASDKFLVYTHSNVDSWNSQFHIFEKAIMSGADVEQMQGIVLDTYGQFESVSREQLDHPLLDSRSLSFMTRIFSTEGTVEQRVNMLLVDSRYLPDLNENGQPDSAEIVAGEVVWDKMGGFTNTFVENSTIRYQITPAQGGTYTLTAETSNPEGLSLVIENYESEYTYTNNSVSLQFVIPEEMAEEEFNLVISLKPGVSVGRIFGIRASN
ncbi:O-antigen ligase family protein [Candidatus Avoscillospira sp. LCP25S3_F1]|uniref:O-antigen ligase family protein n=1 Tax=Candidatus Avoscillospira sp. LCP25S3_F1 TaxID=3438825 RepID=UPI003F8F4377